MEANSVSFKSNEWKSSFSSSSSLKNGGKKRVRKEATKKWEDESHTQKRFKRSTSSFSDGSKYLTPDCEEKAPVSTSTSPLQEKFKSNPFNQIVQKDTERSHSKDTIMADQTTGELVNFPLSKVS